MTFRREYTFSVDIDICQRIIILKCELNDDTLDNDDDDDDDASPNIYH